MLVVAAAVRPVGVPTDHISSRRRSGMADEDLEVQEIVRHIAVRNGIVIPTRQQKEALEDLGVTVESLFPGQPIEVVDDGDLMP
jgi:hypothetical protein